jgi:hypothetical protein
MAPQQRRRKTVCPHRARHRIVAALLEAAARQR